jgi:hypothetical protein
MACRLSLNNGHATTATARRLSAKKIDVVRRGAVSALNPRNQTSRCLIARVRNRPQTASRASTAAPGRVAPDRRTRRQGRSRRSDGLTPKVTRLLRHSKPIGSFPSVRKPPIFQEIRLAIRSKAAKQPIGARWENSRCRRMVKAAAARMTAQRTKPAARVAGIASRIAADISNPPVTRHHHAGYPHRTKLLRVVDVAIALNKPALAKAAATSQMNIMCMA